jgi:hypothetical protein
VKVTHQVASIDNEGVSQGKSQAAYNGNMRNRVVKTSQSGMLGTIKKRHDTNQKK